MILRLRSGLGRTHIQENSPEYSLAMVFNRSYDNHLENWKFPEIEHEHEQDLQICAAK